MNTSRALLLSSLLLCAVPAMAHVGPEALDQHFIEHMLIALAIAVPVGYGLLRFLKRGDSRR
jgi:hypothetical protein